jgi:hypothetical protein
LIADFKVKRQTARPHQGKQKIIKDIVDIWQVIDREKGGALPVKFVAVDPNRLPSVAADQFNLQFLVSAILKLHETGFWTTDNPFSGHRFSDGNQQKS